MVRILVIVCQLILSIVLLIAAVGKLTYPQQFIAAIRVSGIPKPLTHPVAIVIVILELELTSSLVFSTNRLLLLSFVGTFLLLGGFTTWLISVYRRKLHVQCGCFGASHAHVDKGSILRNLIFMGISVVGFFVALSTPGVFLSSSSWVFALDSIIAVGTLLLFLKQRSQGPNILLAKHTVPENKGEQGEGINLLTGGAR